MRCSDKWHSSPPHHITMLCSCSSPLLSPEVTSTHMQSQQFHVVPYNPMQTHAVACSLCSPMQPPAVPCSTTQPHAVSHSLMQLMQSQQSRAVPAVSCSPNSTDNRLMPNPSTPPIYRVRDVGPFRAEYGFCTVYTVGFRIRSDTVRVRYGKRVRMSEYPAWAENLKMGSPFLSRPQYNAIYSVLHTSGSHVAREKTARLGLVVNIWTI